MNKKILVVFMLVLALMFCATGALAYPNYNCATHGLQYTTDVTYSNNNNGTHKVYCKRCDHLVNESPEGCIYPNEGEDGYVAVKPTCTKAGYISKTCKLCGYTLTINEEALGHDWDNGTYVSNGDATCLEDGTETLSCGREGCNVKSEDPNHTRTAENSALGHDWVVTYAWAKNHKSCTATRTCSRGDIENESVTTKTITKKVTDATCTEKGAKVYTASFADTEAAEWAKDAIDKVSLRKLGHWYGEWAPNADGTHSANCKRCDHEATVDCTAVDYVKDDNGTAAYFSFCPVCGEMDDGTRMEIIEDAEAEGKNLPKGEVIVRSNGEFISVGFEYFGSLTQPTEEVIITLPAEIVNGSTLTILNADGTETALETTTDGETVQVTPDFGETPVVLIHMVAAA